MLELAQSSIYASRNAGCTASSFPVILRLTRRPRRRDHVNQLYSRKILKVEHPTTPTPMIDDAD